jgi:hypothetical protein
VCLAAFQRSTSACSSASRIATALVASTSATHACCSHPAGAEAAGGARVKKAQVDRISVILNGPFKRV